MGIPLRRCRRETFRSRSVGGSQFLFDRAFDSDQKPGGSLSETLSNLSRVLRDRKKMREKIKAMSMEAKASAMIIGALPIGVMTLVYLTSPQLYRAFMDDAHGPHDAVRSAVWMAFGVLVMRKMINFDF